MARELGANAHFIRCDVTNEQEPRPVDAAQALGVLRGLSIARGRNRRKNGRKEGPHALASFTRVIGINLIGTFNMIRVVADAMSKLDATVDGERGVLINTASVAAYDGQIGQAAYAASKGGVVGMTLPIARDLARQGIRCVTIAPDFFQRRCCSPCAECRFPGNQPRFLAARHPMIRGLAKHVSRTYAER